MNQETATDLIRLSLFVAAEISAPLLIIALLIGLGVSIFQSVTQITETTLIFIPKIVCFALTLGILFPWMLKVLMRFTYDVIITHWNTIMSSANNAL
jgi:flagellar biosynthetic protein FliQ